MANYTNGNGADIRLIQAVVNTFRTGLTRLIDATAILEPSALQSAVGPYWSSGKSSCSLVVMVLT
jgi:hypothetical protein